MAAADRFVVTIKGKGGHGAAPHLSVDTDRGRRPDIVVALPTIVSRSVDPLESAVISV